MATPQHRQAYWGAATKMANRAHKTSTEDWPNPDWDGLEAALFYAKKGWLVHPCQGKIPIVKEWQHKATDDPAQIKKWWAVNRGAWVGMLCGVTSGRAVIDIDVKNKGRENAKELAREYGEFASGLVVETATGGFHYHHPHSELPCKSSTSKIAKGIDVKSGDIHGSGVGQVILPGGSPYVWRSTDETPCEIPDDFATLAFFDDEEWKHIEGTPGLKKRILSLPRGKWYAEYLINRALGAGGVKFLKPGVIPNIAGYTLETPYFAKAVDDELEGLRDAREGERDNTLTRVAAILGSLAAGLRLDPKSAAVQELADRLRNEALHMHGSTQSKPWTSPSVVDSIIDRQFFGWGFDHPRDLSAVTAQPGRKDRQDQGTALAVDDVQPDPDKAGKREVKLTWLNNVTPEPTEWVWHNCIVRGGLNVWSGNPGGGKSQLSYDAAARVTTGLPWPGQRENTPLRKPGRVIILDAENKTANDIVPRLLAAGADLSKVAVIDSVLRYDDKGNPVSGFLSLQTDIAELDRMLTTLRDVELIIIDPISAYLGTAKSHNDAEVRGVLGPLSKLAEKHNVGVLYICHLNKGSDPNAIYRTQGSVAFIAAARSAFGVSINPEDKDSDDPRRIFGPVKTNLAKKVPSLEFKIESVDVRSQRNPLPIPTSRVRWGEKSDISIEDALNSGQRKKTTEERACEWLLKYLTTGETSTDQVYKDGEIEGFNSRTLQRAAKKLGVDRGARTEFQGSVMWRLPRKEERRQRATPGTTYH